MPQLGPPPPFSIAPPHWHVHAINRRRTRELFDLLDDSIYYTRPISLRNPIVFYEGHIPAFAVNTFIKKALGWKGVDEHLETIFARGIDPESEATSVARGNPAWPSRNDVHQYVEEADRLIEKAIASADLERPGHRMLDQARALWTILEHEEMHQETLGYIWHQVPYACTSVSPGISHRRRLNARANESSARRASPAACDARHGSSRGAFAWDNECPVHQVQVDSFAIDTYKVTNRTVHGVCPGRRVPGPAMVAAGGLGVDRVGRRRASAFWERDGDTWFCRGMFERVALPVDWPVYVTWAEAHAFAAMAGTATAHGS